MLAGGVVRTQPLVCRLPWGGGAGPLALRAALRAVLGLGGAGRMVLTKKGKITKESKKMTRRVLSSLSGLSLSRSRTETVTVSLLALSRHFQLAG